MSRITLSGRSLAIAVGLSTLDTFLRPTYRVLALLIKRMLPVKRILFIERIFSCCRMLQAHALNNQFLRYTYTIIYHIPVLHIDFMLTVTQIYGLINNIICDPLWKN